MADTLKRLGGPIASNGTTDVLVYTVPGATKAVIRSMVIVNNAALVRVVRVAIGDPDTSANIVWSVSTTASSESFVFNGTIIMNAGETLNFDLSTGTETSFTLTVSGVEIT